MSLRRALEALPDDAESRMAIREVIAFFDEHRHESADVGRIARATGLARDRVSRVVNALGAAFVLDCADEERGAWTFEPTPLDQLEVDRFLRTSSVGEARLQRGADRFRARFGHDR